MKKPGFTLSLENTNSEKATTTVKIWSKRKLSEISDFSTLSIGQNRKVGNFGSFLFKRTLSEISEFSILV